MYFSYKQVCDVLYENMIKHQKVLRESTAPQHEREYSRMCMYHYKELRQEFDCLKEKRDW